jgi:hypothetical protein
VSLFCGRFEAHGRFARHLPLFETHPHFPDVPMMMIESIVSQPVFSPLVAAPDKLWPLVLADLRQQMTKATFNTWLVDSRILTAPSTPTFWVVVVRNEYAYEWLTNRLAPVIERTLVGLVDSKVIICFVPRTMRKTYHEPFRRPSARISFDER